MLLLRLRGESFHNMLKGTFPALSHPSKIKDKEEKGRKKTALHHHHHQHISSSAAAVDSVQGWDL